MYSKICILGTLKKKFTSAIFFLIIKKMTYFGAFESAGIGLLNYMNIFSFDLYEERP